MRLPAPRPGLSPGGGRLETADSSVRWSPSYNERKALLIHMREIAAERFFSNPQETLEPVLCEHSPVRVTREDGKAFVVVDADDWDREQETLYVLRNESLAEQIAESIKTLKANSGYRPSKQELDEIHSV